MEFDENDAIEYMRGHVDNEISASYPDDDELFNLIDLIYDYYEANGLLDIDLEEDDDDEIDFDDMMSYITRMLRKDKAATLTPEDAADFVRAYIAYEGTL